MFQNNSVNFVKLTPKMALDLANPPSWAASALPALFGIILSYKDGYNLPVWKAISLFLCCILMQAAVNTLNDYFDYKNGTDSKDDNLEKNDAVLLYNNINPKHALILGLSFLFAGGILGIVSAIGCGTAPFVIGIVGALCVVCYTGGKLPISSLPLGELISGFVMGGLIPTAICSIACKEFKPEALFFSIPFIIGIGLIMMTNNTCDIEKDIKAGRKTLPSILGRNTSVMVYRILTIIWIVSTWLLPLYSIGIIGVISPILIWIIARKSIQFLCSSPLTQENRIDQMKGILKANLLINLTYTAVYKISIFYHS